MYLPGPNIVPSANASAAISIARDADSNRPTTKIIHPSTRRRRPRHRPRGGTVAVVCEFSLLLLVSLCLIRVTDGVPEIAERVLHLDFAQNGVVVLDGDLLVCETHVDVLNAFSAGVRLLILSAQNEQDIPPTLNCSCVVPIVVRIYPTILITIMTTVVAL